MTQKNENPHFDLEGAFPIDVDFDTYEVPPERAQSIREDLVTIKNKTWLSDLFAWVKEKGESFQNAEQSDLVEGLPAKRITWPVGHGLESLQLILDGTLLELSMSGETYLMLQQFPKSDDVLVTHYNSDLAEGFAAVENNLQEELKVFSKSKSEKAKLLSEKLSSFKRADP